MHSPSDLLLAMQEARTKYPNLSNDQIGLVLALQFGCSQAKIASKLDTLIFNSKVESCNALAMTYVGGKDTANTYNRPEKAKVRFARNVNISYPKKLNVYKEKLNE